MTKQELRNQIRKNNLEMAGLTDVMKNEKREASAVETQTLNNLKEDNTDLQSQLAETVNIDTRNATLVGGEKPERVSILRAVREVVEGRSAYLDNAYFNAGKEASRKAGLGFEGQIQLPVEFRDDNTKSILAGTANQGAETVATQKFNLLGALYANMVLASAGAQFLTGLVSNGSIPIYSGTQANWEEETGNTENGGGSFTEVNISPKRL